MLVKDILKVVPNDEVFEIYYNETWYTDLEKEAVLSYHGDKEVKMLEADLSDNYVEYPVIHMHISDTKQVSEDNSENNTELDNAINEAIKATNKANALAEEQHKVYLALNEANEQARQKRAEAEHMLKEIIKAGS